MQKQGKNKNNFIGFGVASFAVVSLVFVGGVILGQKDVLSFNLGVITDKVGSYGASNPVDANNELPENLSYVAVEELYDALRRNFDGELNEQKLLEGLMHGLTNATGDPYTEYFSAVDAASFKGELDGEFTGIGAELGKENGAIVVVSPLAGFPAEAAGLKTKDVIVKIDDQDSNGFTITQAVKLIRGEAGTDVTLTVVRDQSEVVEITITRAVIDIPSVTSTVEDGVGIITVSRFSDDTTLLAREAANKFIADGVDKVVLDMRGNPGGYLTQAVSLSSLWLERGSIVVDVRRDGESVETLKTRNRPILGSVPTIVLINGGSASASEIVAGALQDHNRAQLVGTTSYGKGSVQNLQDIGNDSNEDLLKVTTARWYTPNGKNIDKEGISPDIEVEFTEEDVESGNDPQLNKAKELLSN